MTWESILIGTLGAVVIPMWCYVEWMAWRHRLPSMFGPMPPRLDK